MPLKFNILRVQYVVIMDPVQIRDIAEAEKVLAGYMLQVKELLGKDLTLARMKPLLDSLGHPEEKLKIIHIAGTSGKTSTAYYLTSLLAVAGKKAGLTVSPHIDSVTERVQVNLIPMRETDFCQSLSEFLGLIQNVAPKPTYFELMIAFAYWYFAKVSVDYAVIETGLGGLHDATNVAGQTDKICVITDIGLDHTKVLGNTLAEIAGQKAGIIHPGNQVFMHQQLPVVMDVVAKKAKDQGAILNVLSKSLGSEYDLESIPIFQRRNWSLAKFVYDYVAQRDGSMELNQQQLAASKSLSIPGRMETQSVGHKTLVMDGAHNRQKMMAFVESFAERYPGQKAAILLALKEGKEYQTILPLIKPICSTLIITGFNVDQDLPASATDPETLAKAALELGFSRVSVEADNQKAYQQLLNSPEDLCVITGSFYLLSCVRPLILNAND